MTISNNRIKLVKSLQQKKFRDLYGLFTVEGGKMVTEALRSGFEIDAVYRREEVGEEAMSRMSSQTTPSPVLAVVRKPSEAELDIHNGLYLALDSIRDPGNLGTIMRIADWFGIDGIFAAPDTVDLYNPKTVQSTMGAVFRVPFCYAGIPSVCERFLSAGGRVYGTFLDGADIYVRELSTGADSPVLIVIGNESNGISPDVEKKVSDRLFIPPYPADDPGSESLNAAVAAAITVAEFRRRIR